MCRKQKHQGLQNKKNSQPGTQTALLSIEVSHVTLWTHCSRVVRHIGHDATKCILQLVGKHFLDVSSSHWVKSCLVLHQKALVIALVAIADFNGCLQVFDSKTYIVLHKPEMEKVHLKSKSCVSARFRKWHFAQFIYSLESRRILFEDKSVTSTHNHKNMLATKVSRFLVEEYTFLIFTKQL